MWWFFGVAVAQIRLHQACTSEVLSACRERFSNVVTLNVEQQQSDSDTTCVQCTLPHCNNSNPDTGLQCFPFTKTCSLCGDPNLAMVSSGYTITVRSQCGSTSACDGDVNLTSPVTLTGYDSITVKGHVNFSGVINIQTCPAFVFTNVKQVTVQNLNIYCNGTNNVNTAPAILIQHSATLQVTAEDILATGWVLSTIFVSGGDQTVTPVLDRTTITSPSRIANISIGNSVFTQTYAVTLVDFSGVIDVTGLEPFTRVLMYPASGGSLTVPDDDTSHRLIITNMAPFSMLEGHVISTEVTTDRDEYGYTQNDVDSTEKTLARYIALVALILFMIGIVANQRVILRHYEEEDLGIPDREKEIVSQATEEERLS